MSLVVGCHWCITRLRPHEISLFVEINWSRQMSVNIIRYITENNTTFRKIWCFSFACVPKPISAAALNAWHNEVRDVNRYPEADQGRNITDEWQIWMFGSTLPVTNIAAWNIRHFYGIYQDFGWGFTWASCYCSFQGVFFPPTHYGFITLGGSLPGFIKEISDWKRTPSLGSSWIYFPTTGFHPPPGLPVTLPETNSEFFHLKMG